jgi:phosphatidate cytidylyltransferase
MLRTRLWMGAVLIALVVGVLAVDEHLAPWFPFLFALVVGLALVATFELLHLLPTDVRPASWLCCLGIAAVVAANWIPHLSMTTSPSPWLMVGVSFAAFVLLVFLVEMATFREPGYSVTRMALAVWLLSYLGLLPSFLMQLRWLPPTPAHSTAALMLTVFVPKCCDIGAYCTGRVIGKHQMTPALSLKKTWEGAAGGLATAVLAAVLLDRFGPAAVLEESVAAEAGFGLSLGVAGMFGDLAESLVKRDCRHKDASQAVPGYGGVLDVVDAILFAAPVSYVWLAMLQNPG